MCCPEVDGSKLSRIVTVLSVRSVCICCIIHDRKAGELNGAISTKIALIIKRYFLREAHSNEQTPFTRVMPSGSHFLAESLKQCGLSVLLTDTAYWRSWDLNRRSLYPETDILSTRPMCSNDWSCANDGNLLGWAAMLSKEYRSAFLKRFFLDGARLDSRQAVNCTATSWKDVRPPRLGLSYADFNMLGRLTVDGTFDRWLHSALYCSSTPAKSLNGTDWIYWRM